MVDDDEPLRVTPHCMARGCLYDAEDAGQDFLCLEHWERVPVWLRMSLLAAEKGTDEWQQLAEAACDLLRSATVRAAFARARPWPGRMLETRCARCA
jgi:hypothetical protein